MFEKKINPNSDKMEVNKIRSFSKVLGGVLPVLFLMAVLSAPVASADSGSCSNCGSEGSCPAAENIENVEVAVENFGGFEEKRAVINAWRNRDTRLLVKELVWKDRCTPWLPKSEAQEVTMYKDGEVLSQSTVVKIPFRAHGRDLDAQIVYRENETSERAYATVAGSASVLEEPMDILKENARYHAIVENLEEQGYTVKEESAQVVKSYTPADYASVPSCIEDEVWNTASINVKAVRGDEVKYITALVCIDKSKVLAVADGYWDCVGECAAHFALEMHICYYPCLAAVAAPNPSTWGACAACVGAPAAGCAVSCALPW